MTSRTSVFQVKFTTDGSGAVKADIESVAKSAVDSSKSVNSNAGKEWEDFGRKIGTSIRWAGVAVAAGIALIVKNTIDAQRELAQLDAVLLSTGNAAGFTRDQLVEMGGKLKGADVFGGGAITEAQTRLLSYSNIVGETFPRALQVVLDQSARLGMSITQSAETVGRALGEPTKAMGALAQQGFSFTQSQKDTIKALEATGRTAEAQALILDMLEESYAGAADAAQNTLGGALIALKNNFNDLLTGDSGSEGIKGATKAVNDLATTMKDPSTKEAFENLTGWVADLTSRMAQGALALIEYYNRVQDVKSLGNGSQSPKSATEVALQSRQDAVFQTIQDLEGGAAGKFKAIYSGTSALKPGDYLKTESEAIERLKTEWLELDKQIIATRIKTTQAGLKPQFLEGNDVLPDSATWRPGVHPKPKPVDTSDPSDTKLKKVKKELSDYEKLMADLGVYEQIWADAAVDASNAKVDAWEAENEAQQRRTEIFQDMLADIQLETEAMGMSSEQIEIRNNLLRAGVDAESERGQAIIDATKKLQESREAWGMINDLKDITTDFAVSAAMNFGSAGDAVEEFGDRLKRMAIQMLAEKAIQWLFGMFFGGTQVTAGSTEFGQFGAGSTGWIGVGKSGGGKMHGPGTTTSDSIPARLSKDEWVINADAASHYGDNMMADINAKRFAVGGPVSGYSSAASGAYSGMPAIEFNVSNNTNGKAEMEEPTLTMENGKLIIQTAVNLAVGKINDGLARKGSPTNKSMMAGLGRGTSYG